MVLNIKVLDLAIQLTCATKHAINMIGANQLISTNMIIIATSWVRDVLMLEKKVG